MNNKMNLSGRKTSTAYEIYGFMPKVQNGKHTAICLSCHRELQNTAALRLQKHRNSCAVTNASNGGDSVNFTNSGMKRHPASKTDLVEQNESTHVTVKAENCNMEFEDTIINNEAHDNTYDTMENFQDHRPSRKSAAKKDRTNDKLKAKIQYFKEKSKYFVSELNNLKFEETLMILKVKKLRLEIEQLEVDN